jgi:hypothetical protein
VSNAFVEKIRTEPVLVTALVQTALTLVAAFGLDLNAEQVAGIIAFTGAILAFVARSKVTSVRALETGDVTPEVVDAVHENEVVEDAYEGDEYVGEHVADESDEDWK